MPARRRITRKGEKTPINKKKAMWLLILASIVAVSVFVINSLLNKTENYFTVAEALPSGDLLVRFVDLKEKESYELTIPKDTEVNLARQRGILRASSVKKIIDSENVDRQIIADTVMKTFHFPIDYWKMGILTDMPLIVRLRLKFAEITGMNFDELALEETSYLISDKLPDGEEGYRVRDTMPLVLQSVFADPLLSEERLAVHIVNKTGKESYYLNNVVKVFDILAMKVAPVDDESAENSDCQITSLNELALRRLSSVFNCSARLAEPSAFDVEIIFGERFFQRF